MQESMTINSSPICWNAFWKYSPENIVTVQSAVICCAPLTHNPACLDLLLINCRWLEGNGKYHSGDTTDVYLFQVRSGCSCKRFHFHYKYSSFSCFFFFRICYFASMHSEVKKKKNPIRNDANTWSAALFVTSERGGTSAKCQRGAGDSRKSRRYQDTSFNYLFLLMLLPHRSAGSINKWWNGTADGKEKSSFHI